MPVDSLHHRNQPYRSPHHSRWGDAVPKSTFLQEWETPTHEAGWYTRKELKDMKVEYVGRYFVYPTLSWESGFTSPNPHPTVTRPAKNKTPRTDENLWVKAPASNHEFVNVFGQGGLDALATPTDGMPYDARLLDMAITMAVRAKVERQGHRFTK
jgi:hypothetical protein